MEDKQTEYEILSLEEAAFLSITGLTIMKR